MFPDVQATDDSAAFPGTSGALYEVLLFRSRSRLFACLTSQAAKVLPCPRLVPLPLQDRLVAGLVNYRGRIIGVVHSAALLPDQLAAPGAGSWLIVLKGKDFLSGLQVDEVIGIETIPESCFFFNPEESTGFLPKSFQFNGEIAALLAVDALLADPAVIVNQ